MASIIDYFSQNPAHLFYTITGLCLVMELGVLGMSGPLLFVALGSLLTGILMSLGVITGWEMAILSLGVLTALSALLLWKPFKRFQNERIAQDTSSDMIGRVLPVTQMVSRDQGAVSYSGIEWQVRLNSSAEPVVVGNRVRVVAVDGALLLVQPE
jgi:membrane protein implicated in regulation of membrane protease activity